MLFVSVQFAYHAFFLFLCSMETTSNSVLIQNATLSEIERMIDRAVARRIEDFYESVRSKPSPLVRRKEAARMLGVSLPTLDAYGKHGLLHPRHVGGRVFYKEEELLAVKGR